MTNNTSPKHILLTQDWQVNISLKELSITYNNQLFSYTLRQVTNITHDNSNDLKIVITIANSTSNANSLIYELVGLSVNNYLHLPELYTKYTCKLARLRQLVIKINDWHQSLVSKLEHEFNFRGYITDSFAKEIAQSTDILPLPKDKYNLLADSDVIELLKSTMPANKLLPLEDYKLTLNEFIKKFNNIKCHAIITNNLIFFNNIEKSPLTDEQIKAVINLNDRVLLNAAAGSGKTSTMVARMGYLCAFNFHENGQILALAYNTKAVQELNNRTISRLTNLGIRPDALRFKTFHALGLEIIRQITGKTPNLAPGVDNEDGGFSFFHKCIQQLFYRKQSFRILLTIFNEAFALTSQNISSIKSKQKYLSDCAISLLKLANIDGALGESVPKSSQRYIAINQHCAVVLHPQKEQPVEHIMGYQSIGSVSYMELMQGTGYFKLLKIIRRYYLKHEPLNNELNSCLTPITNICQNAIFLAKKPKFWRITNLLKAFLTHSKNSLKDEKYLENILFNDTSSKHNIREKLFYIVFRQAHIAWRKYLQNAIDYEDMLNIASQLIEKHQWCLPYSHILIDECQDFSGARARLIQNIVKYSPARIFAVGDDWQSINRFSGSELSVMTEFNRYFGPHDTLKLETTFRCSQSICNIASNFVQKNPKQLKKVVHSTFNCTEKPIKVFEQDNELEIKYAIKERVLEIIRSNPKEPLKILLLGRYNSDSIYCEETLKDPRLANFCQFMTVHSSKGLEGDYVILIRVTDELLGFPSKITDDDLLQLVEPSPENFPYAEERRLFYVALTRAKRNVSIFTTYQKNSDFVIELVTNDLYHIKKEHILIPEGLIPPEILCRNKDCRGYYIKRSSQRGTFWGCSNYPECRSALKSLKTLSDNKTPMFLKKKRTNKYF